MCVHRNQTNNILRGNGNNILRGNGNNILRGNGNILSGIKKQGSIIY
jgi:hypothetical protein